jgi:hypothetical protein
VRRLGGLRGGDGGEQLVCWPSVSAFHGVVVAGLRLAVDPAQGAQELPLVVRRVDGEELVDEGSHLGWVEPGTMRSAEGG